jgi:NAD(P)-dependent dehydrogenase (short-subunit alcohol dehydrogenase family)
MAQSDSGKFVGKVAFVTGGGTGIGKAAALAFAREGASVVVAGPLDAHLRETAREVEALGVRALAVDCDVARSEDVKQALERTIEAFGHLDYALNNAGIEQPVAPLHEIDDDQFQRLVDINLRGMFLCMKHEIPLLLRQGGGAIVNTASGAGVKGFQGQSAYAATKHGVIGLSKSAALDYAALNIRINVVAPGIIATPMMDRFTGGTDEGRARVIAQEPIGRMGRPEEIAETVTWLCSDSASFVTGAVLVADGGQTA